MLIKIFTLITLFILHLGADEFSDWKAAQDKEFNQSQQEFIEWKKNEQKEFKEYKMAQEEAFKEYKKEIHNFWPTTQMSTQHKWVEYANDYKTKKVVNFKDGSVDLEVIAEDEKDAQKKLEGLYLDLLNDSIKAAYAKDKLEQMILEKLNKPKQILASEEKVLSDILTEDDMKNMYKSIKTKTPKIQRYKNNNIYKITLKLPSNTKIKKAQIYQKDVNSNSSKQKIPAELIYAIIDSESSFNPMARSVIPAYGLMQIVPQTAGIDSYYFLYNRKKAPTANFLYNTNKNITIGTAYLHLLYFKYLNDIKDPMSKLYCVVSAYNTGAGNVSKAFIGNTNINKAIKKINSMDSDSVYKHLLRNLPYNETRAYLKKVVDKTSGYYKLIKQNKL